MKFDFSLFYYFLVFQFYVLHKICIDKFNVGMQLKCYNYVIAIFVEL